MKPTAGYAKPRGTTAPLGKTQLNLQRRPKPEPEDDLETQQKNAFWKWVLLVALFHVLVFVGIYIYYAFSATPKPPEQFMSLLPPGDTVKGSPGAQQAHKLGANTPAAPSHQAPPPPAPVRPAQPKPVAPPPAAEQPKPVTPPAPVKPPPPIIKENAPPIAEKPVKPPPKPQPPKPVKPKVKVDLHEIERADAAAAEAAAKPTKHHSEKPVKTPDETQNDADSSPDNTGLSKQQIAEKLGDKLNASGTHNAIKSGTSGAPNGQQNKFDEFYNLIAQQVHDDWNGSNASTSVQMEPVVGMHVQHDGFVPPDSVHLIRSSGDPAYDEEAIATVKRLGYLHAPLPDGCPPDIKINFNPNP